MPQLHVRAEEGAVAPIVLLPGDPDRASLIAERFFGGATRYTDYRHLFGYTGTYRGVPVSVQTTGMGCPSLAIVVEELIRLGARTLVRVGTCGAVAQAVAPGDLVVATAAVANDGTTRQYLQGEPHSPTADFALTRALADAATATARRTHVGLIQTEDAFYATSRDDIGTMQARGVLAIEMEASALFTLGALRGVRTGCMLVASNNVGDQRFAPQEMLHEAVLDMTKAALEASVMAHQGAGREPTWK